MSLLRAVASALALGAAACGPRAVPPSEGVPVRLLRLDGPLARPDAEISGMSWLGDTLVLLPQYPERFGGALFAVDKAEILARLDGAPAPLRARTIAFEAPGLDRLPGYEGLESIAFDGMRAFLTVEASPRRMRGVVVSASVVDEGRRVRVDATSAPLDPPVALDNMSYESILVAGDTLVVLFEANGADVNPRPTAQVLGLDLVPRGTVPFPPLDFRVADATPLDPAGRFWVTNVFYVGDRHLRARTSRSVERLVELRWTGAGVERTDTPPIVLQRVDDKTTRNWEALVRLDDRGFLLATDTYPGTLLGFVPRRP